LGYCCPPPLAVCGIEGRGPADGAALRARVMDETRGVCGACVLGAVLSPMATHGRKISLKIW